MSINDFSRIPPLHSPRSDFATIEDDQSGSKNVFVRTNSNVAAMQLEKQVVFYNVNDDPLYGRKSCIVFDLFGAGLFFAFIILMLVYGGMYGRDGVILKWNDTDNYFIKYCASIAAIAIGFAIIWTLLMMFFAKFFIYASLLALIVLQIVLAVTWTLRLQAQAVAAFWWPALVFSIGAVLIAILLCIIRKQIAFSSALLQVAGIATLSDPLVFVFSVLYSIIKMVFFIMTVYAGLGIQAHFQLSDVATGFMWVALALGIFWTYTIFRGLVQVMTADVVATWARDSTKHLYAVKAFTKSASIHVGGVTIGSFFVSIIDIVNFFVAQLARMFSEEGNCCASCCMCCLGCCLGGLEAMMEIFNKYAYCFMGALNMSFCSAGKEVLGILKTAGVLAITTDIIVGQVLWLGALVIGGGCAAIGDTFATDNQSMYPHASALAAIAFFIGYFSSMVVFDVVGGGVSTVFVLYCREYSRVRMAEIHEYEYNELNRVWTEAYPGRREEL